MEELNLTVEELREFTEFVKEQGNDCWKTIAVLSNKMDRIFRSTMENKRKIGYIELWIRTQEMDE